MLRSMISLSLPATMIMKSLSNREEQSPRVWKVLILQLSKLLMKKSEYQILHSANSKNCES